MNDIIPLKYSGINGNCYLIQKDDCFILVDTSSSRQRKKIEEELIKHGCTPGKLKLIVLTHGDFDHTGNALFLKLKYNCPVAMHRDDSIIVEQGNMFINKNKKNMFADVFTRLFLRIDNFSPDLFLDEKFKLNSYGIDAGIIHLPGHSKGSIGIITAENDLICGDLFENRIHPRLYYIDDAGQSSKSLELLKELSINNIYPGHGERFKYSEFAEKIK